MTMAKPHGASPRDDRPARKARRDQITRLQVTADPCPQVLLRVLGLIAQHGTIPLTIDFARRPRSVRIEVTIDMLSPGALETLRHKVTAIPTVRDARTVEVREGYISR